MRKHPRRRVRLAWSAAAVVLALPTALVTATDAPVAAEPAAAAAARSHVASREQIGTSVEDRPIYAYHLGDPHATTRVVLLGNMHGDEPAGIRTIRAIQRGPTIDRINLWVVPTINPDGVAAHTRQNAHGVDLNRNWGYQWVRQTGRYDSGPHPFSEPETQAMRVFLNRTHPLFLVSFHQPLHGVDSDQPKNKHLMNRLATNLGLPKKPFTCGGVCHGTMTGWYNHNHIGACITVEFGSAPGFYYLTHRAATGTVHAVFGHYPPG